MREVSCTSGAFSVTGAVETRVHGQGLGFQRLPDWALDRTPDPVLHLMSGMAAGIRLGLVSDTERLEVDVTATGVRYSGGVRRPVTFDLYADGVLHGRRSLTAGPTALIDYAAAPPNVILQPSVTETLVFDNLPARPADLELWLPQAASVEVKAVRIDDGATAAPLRDGRPVWTHYGSSISHGMDADGPSETWPAVAARSLGLSLVSLGFAAQCQMDGFVARLLSRLPCDRISLKLGVNLVNQDVMRERAFIPAVHAFLDTIRDARPTVPILVISPLICPMHETAPGPTLRAPPGYRTVPRPAELAFGALTNTGIRGLLHAIVTARQAAGDTALHYLDGRALLGPADVGVLHDGLHPNADGLRLIGRRFAAWAGGPSGWGPWPVEDQSADPGAPAARSSIA